jgi:hypothetical protein
MPQVSLTASVFSTSEDEGIPSDLSTVVRCEAFPISGFDFPELKGSGDDLKGSRSPIELAANFHE